MKKLSITLAAVLLSASAAVAAPCATGTTTNAQGQDAAKGASKDTSSKVDSDSTAKTSPGAKAESPGTVGAMNQAGSNTSPEKGEKPLSEGQVVQGQNSDGC